MKKPLFWILITSFCVAFIFQGLRWHNLFLLDSGFWSDQARFVATGDPMQYDATRAYGHPGGPVIEGVILTHVLGVSYEKGLILFLTLFNSIIITLGVVVAYMLRKDLLLSATVLIVLSINRLYRYATPPSGIVLPLLALVVLLTLYLYEKKERIYTMMSLWSLAAGAAIASRADSGGIIVGVCVLSLLFKIGWKKTSVLAAGAFVSFVVFDPFMWYMPFRHMSDLIKKMIYHYEVYAVPMQVKSQTIINISLLAGICIILILIFMWTGKKRLLPYRLSLPLIAVTVGLYFILLTARYQAYRYFIPIILIWEMLLPFVIFNAVSDIPPDARLSKTHLKYILAGSIMLYEIIPFIFLFV